MDMINKLDKGINDVLKDEIDNIFIMESIMSFILKLRLRLTYFVNENYHI